MEENYTYFGFGIIALMLLAGIIVASQSLHAKEFEGATASITLSIEEDGKSEAAYFSEVPAKQLFSRVTAINLSSEAEPEKTIRCEFACTKQD